MSRICDRSPCDSLLQALGRYIYGCTTDTGRLEGFVLSVAVRQTSRLSKFKLKKHSIEIEYCPFCGTRIEEIQNVLIVERFTRPRRRRRTKYDFAS